jgi:DNA-binding transcriptional ArsR family regulator
METSGAILALSALAHEGRLNAFRLLVKAGKVGMPSGEIARTLGVPANTLSNSLTVLASAGLVESRREGKLAIYTVRFVEVTGLLGFLIEDCCAASEEICAPLSEIALKSCC